MPTIVHQATEYTSDLKLNLPGNWTPHHTPSGYMDRDGWFKTIHNFVQLSGASASNLQYLFFDGHDSHWDSAALKLLWKNFVEPFFLQAGNSENYQPNACYK